MPAFTLEKFPDLPQKRRPNRHTIQELGAAHIPLPGHAGGRARGDARGRAVVAGRRLLAAHEGAEAAHFGDGRPEAAREGELLLGNVLLPDLPQPRCSALRLVRENALPPLGDHPAAERNEA